uniref:LRRCT domain-containing protein n=1 Tax=Astyanax mexicanus TaxID=7994 RepID=A0A3B1INU7_ASTMX
MRVRLRVLLKKTDVALCSAADGTGEEHAADLFTHQQKLQKLYLSNNQLSALPGGIFLNLPNLRQISLYDNQLQSLPAGTFGPMPLQDLWLYDNMLTRLEENAFSNLTNVRLLVLSRNQLSRVSPGAFNGLTSLEEISLHTNQLATIEEGVFRGLPKLLQNNSLPHLKQEILDGLTGAESVVLAENPWRCDHDIVPLRDWLRKNSNKVKNVTSLTCFSPSNLIDVSITNLNDVDLLASPTSKSSEDESVSPTDNNYKRTIINLFDLLLPQEKYLFKK